MGGVERARRALVGLRAVRRREPDRGGRRRRRPQPLASLVAAGLLILLTGAFLAPLFEDLPQATLAAIVIVAVAGFFDFAELRRFARVRRSAVVFAGLALAGVLVLGVLQGLIVAAGPRSLVVALSRPRRSRRATVTGAGAADARTGARRACSSAQRRAAALRERERGQGPRARARPPPQPRVVVLDLESHDRARRPDADTLGELADALRRDGIELRLARVPARRSRPASAAGLSDQVRASTPPR